MINDYCRAELWQIHWPVGIPLLVVPPLLSFLNLLWFSKIGRGAVKLFFGRHHKVSVIGLTPRSVCHYTSKDVTEKAR